MCPQEREEIKRAMTIMKFGKFHNTHIYILHSSEAQMLTDLNDKWK